MIRLCGYTSQGEPGNASFTSPRRNYSQLRKSLSTSHLFSVSLCSLLFPLSLRTRVSLSISDSSLILPWRKDLPESSLNLTSRDHNCIKRKSPAIKGWGVGGISCWVLRQATRRYYTTWGIQPTFSNNCKWSGTFNNCIKIFFINKKLVKIFSIYH